MTDPSALTDTSCHRLRVTPVLDPNTYMHRLCTLMVRDPDSVDVSVSRDHQDFWVARYVDKFGAPVGRSACADPDVMVSQIFADKAERFLLALGSVGYCEAEFAAQIDGTVHRFVMSYDPSLDTGATLQGDTTLRIRTVRRSGFPYPPLG